VGALLGTETAVVRVALGVVALHVADDAFFQPGPGNSAADHVAGGLVPLALLIGVAFVYPRLRAGFRASLALAFGVLAITTGTEAAYYATHGGMSGDDYTGLLTVPAGLVLLGVGIVTLWRSRRTDDGRLWRYVRRFLLTVAGLLVAGLVLFPISLGYVVTHTARAESPPPKLGAAYEDVAFTTRDGLRLEGWYVPSKNGAIVIAFPGRAGAQKQARMLAAHGYGVLLFDRRGEGESEGDPNVFGWDGARDLHAAVAYLKTRPDVDPERIGAIGLSVGGEMLIQAAAESDEFAAIVSEGGSGRSIRDDLANADGTWGKAGAIASPLPMLALATAVFTDGLPPPSLESLVRRIDSTAVFFAYSGQVVEERTANRGFYAAAGEPKEIWEVPEGGHIGGITARPAEYEERVIGFFDRELLEQS
jgi:dienelactone hydrolase